MIQNEDKVKCFHEWRYHSYQFTQMVFHRDFAEGTIPKNNITLFAQNKRILTGMWINSVLPPHFLLSSLQPSS